MLCSSTLVLDQYPHQDRAKTSTFLRPEILIVRAFSALTSLAEVLNTSYQMTQRALSADACQAGPSPLFPSRLRRKHPKMSFEISFSRKRRDTRLNSCPCEGYWCEVFTDTIASPRAYCVASRSQGNDSLATTIFVNACCWKVQQKLGSFK
jgi:hypothetical protein